MATGSMDSTAKLWSVENGGEVTTLAVSYMHIILLIALTH